MVLRVGSVSKPRLLYVFMISFIPWNLRYHNQDIIWTGLNQCVFLLSRAFPPTFSSNTQNPNDFPSEVRLRLKVKSIVLLCEQPWIAQRTSIRKSTGFCLCVLGIVVFEQAIRPCKKRIFWTLYQNGTDRNICKHGRLLVGALLSALYIHAFYPAFAFHHERQYFTRATENKRSSSWKKLWIIFNLEIPAFKRFPCIWVRDFNFDREDLSTS